MRRVLFLDFDGVLNNTAWSISEARKFNRALAKAAPGASWKTVRASSEIDHENLRYLGLLMFMVPGLEIVVSSAWRKGRTLGELRGYLAPAVAPRRVVGVTGSHESRLRHVEITQWLDAQLERPVARFLALDDDTFDMTPLGGNFIHVHRDAGLTWAHVQASVRHLMGAR